MLVEEIFNVKDKVAIITGASSGIGAHLAGLLVNCGAFVVLAARREEKLAQLSSEFGDRCRYVRCDVTNDLDLGNLVEYALAEFGKIDICINNAGVAAPAPAETESPNSFRAVLSANLESVFVLSQLVAREMLKENRGSIINVASVLGVVASGQIPQASYAASKAGVINLTRELAAQWSRRGIRVNAIAPGWFPSEMTSEMFSSERQVGWIDKRTPIGRPGELHELDGAVLLLASEAGSYISGETIIVDGGWSII